MGENDTMAKPPPSLPSDQKFGLFFSVVLIIAAAYAWHTQLPAFALLLGVLATGFGVLAKIRPHTLHRLNKLWAQLGILIGRFVSPIVLGLFFFLLITPVALVTRLCGRDELRLKQRRASSYWVKREPIGPAPESFNNQF